MLVFIFLIKLAFLSDNYFHLSICNVIRWVDLINKLRCPQCIGYRAWNIQQLERHVVLHCKSRPPLLRHHYIRELRGLTTVSHPQKLLIP